MWMAAGVGGGRVDCMCACGQMFRARVREREIRTAGVDVVQVWITAVDMGRCGVHLGM